MSTSYNIANGVHAWLTERFLSYSRRIRATGLGTAISKQRIMSGQFLHVDTSVYMTWSTAPGGLTAIFSNTTRLGCTLKEDPEYYASLVSQLCSPRMLQIHAEVCAYSAYQIQATKTLLDSLGDRSTDLRILSIRCYVINSSLCKPISQHLSLLVQGAFHLTELTTNIPLSREAILSISRWPNLESLILEPLGDDPEPIEFASAESGDIFFPRLRSLVINSSSTGILHHITSPFLRNIVWYPIQRPDLQKCPMELIRAGSNHPQLECIAMKPSSLRVPLSAIANFEALPDALASIPKLKTLHLKNHCLPFTIATDLALRLLESSPPHLVTIEAARLPCVPWSIFVSMLSDRRWVSPPFGLLLEPLHVPTHVSLEPHLVQPEITSIFIGGKLNHSTALVWASALQHLFPNLVTVCAYKHVSRDGALVDLLKAHLPTSIGLVVYDPPR
jgi:hypothetical protein